ncbi:MAG TPA: serine/threonine protein kinase, partial [Nitrospirae bacterium]|nr:serine/threonine protein kinase [Nitrospirota bacterium]
MDKPFCPQCEREYDPGVKFCQHDGAELIIRSEDTMSGEVFDGRYRVIHKIGEGGMGAVYKAQQISTGKNVAIKVVSKHLTENPATVRRFQREVKLQSKLEHPNIVTVIDFSQTKDGHYFFVMPFVEGKSLRRMILDDGKLSLNDFHDLASQMCDGLEYAHRRGIIHRDIKGDNIAIAQMEHQRVVKILDFGLAKAIQEDGSLKTGTELTQQGRVLGTPAYMSPEQAKGEIDKVGKPSDIYSLGVILYQML